MPRRLPPLNSLPSFEAAARHLSFSKAAEELHVTHGAVSRAIRHLETQLGVQLFTRKVRSVALTPQDSRQRQWRRPRPLAFTSSAKWST